MHLQFLLCCLGVLQITNQFMDFLSAKKRDFEVKASKVCDKSRFSRAQGA